MEDKLLSTTKSSSISSEATIELPDWLYHGSTVAIIPELNKPIRFVKKDAKRLEIFDDISKFAASPALFNDRTYQSFNAGVNSVMLAPPNTNTYNITINKDFAGLNLMTNALHLHYFMPYSNEAVGIKAGAVSPFSTCIIDVSSDTTNTFTNSVSYSLNSSFIEHALQDQWTAFSISGRKINSAGTVAGTGADMTAIRWIRFRFQMSTVFIGSKLLLGALDAVPLPAKGKVIFTFDDNWLCQHNVVANILAKYNYPAVMFPSAFAQRTGGGQATAFTCASTTTTSLTVASGSGNLSVNGPISGANIVAGTYITDINGTTVTISQAPTAAITAFTSPTYMTVDQMLHLQNTLGWQIGSQDYNVDGVTYQTGNQWLIESSKNLIAQSSAGFHGGADWSVYGGKRYSPNPEVRKLARRLYRSTRLFFNGNNSANPMVNETWPFGDPHAIRCMNWSSGFTATTVLNRVQEYVQAAIDNKDIAIFGEHNGIYSFTNENGVAFAALVEYIRTQELLGLVEVVTFNSLANSQ